jgi:hypothetical protein
VTLPTPLHTLEDDTRPVPNSFIIKIWFDGVPVKGKRIDWHGMITHVPSGENHSIRSLGAAFEFIEGFLERAGARVSWCYTLKSWLHNRIPFRDD